MFVIFVHAHSVFYKFVSGLILWILENLEFDVLCAE